MVFTTSLEWDSVQFSIMNIGTTNVTISEIQINGLTNSSSPGWRVENGDNILLPGQGISITLNVLKYFSQGLTGDSESYKFAFVTSKGNMYYCVPMPTDLLYTRFEKIEIISVSAVKGSDGNFTITIQLRNTGSADATIHSVMVNGKPLTEYTPAITTNPVLGTTGLTIVAGGDDQLQVLIDGDVFMSGTTIEVKIHTAAGMDYPRLITLP